MHIAFLFIIPLFPIIFFAPVPIVGYNSKRSGKIALSAMLTLTQRLQGLATIFTTSELHLAYLKYKNFLNGLNLSEFTAMKMFGVVATKRRVNKASRGYDKLYDLLITTRLQLYGRILSTCCGRGGWEQVLAPNPKIREIHAITFGSGPGHLGHENFTSKPFEGMHKVKVTYGDARALAPQTPDFLLFDGGESHPSPEKEAQRFHELLEKVTRKHLHNHLRGFIFKILVPTYPPTIKYLTEIQQRYQMGALYRSAHSRTSNLELYFISTQPKDITLSIRRLIPHMLMKAAAKRQEPSREYTNIITFVRPLIPTKLKLLQPLPMHRCIKELGSQIPESGRTFAQWESLGIYPVGAQGSSNTNIPPLAAMLTKGLVENLPSLTAWLATDTTPNGFSKTFLSKVDVAPGESNPYEEELRLIYLAKAKHYLDSGFRYREYTWEEVEFLANKQGAAHYVDIHYSNIREFLSDPHWIEKCEKVRKALESGTPSHAIFSTMGKREKKLSPHGPRGSRMVAFLPIAMRLVELKIFGNLSEITHPELNHFAVGGMGLHDLGMRIAERWVEVGESTDIAAFDTRVGVLWQTLESMFLQALGFPKVCQSMYRIYAYPHILIPLPSKLTRSELLAGRGQRMSGSKITYDMNTETRNNITLLRWVKAFKLPNSEIPAFISKVMKPDNPWRIHGVTSGDDETSLFPAAYSNLFSQTYGIFHEIGFPRKDIPATMPCPIIQSISDVEFCSHSYERVSYYQESTSRVEYRYMPTRPVHEIVGKARIWLGCAHTGLEREAWMSAQGNNLLVNYHHLRTTRALGMAYKAIAHPNLILTAEGSTFLKKPWMREGNIVDVINTILFGDSTRYPVPGFQVERLRHCGYLPVARELAYDPGSMQRTRAVWRDRLKPLCQQIITNYSTGGDMSIFSDWRERTLVRL